MNRVVILIGAPGSGKGTQAVRLAAATALPHVSTGDLFRANIKSENELGSRAKVFMDAGDLVPDGLVLDMLFDRVGHDDCRIGYILDGFPRTIPQAEAYDARLDGTLDQRVANLEVEEDVIVERAVGRLLCKQCDGIHHQIFAPPRVEGVCDACGGPLSQRPDDVPDVVRERLKVYAEQTAPLVRYYEERSLLMHVDGSGSPDEVFQRLLTAVQPDGEARG